MRESLKQDFIIIEWSNGIEWYSQIPLTISLKSDLFMNSMFKYHWEYHWNRILILNGPMVLNDILKYHWHWVKYIYCWMVCSNTTESTIETLFYYWMGQWYSMIFWNAVYNTTEVWFIVEECVQIPLRIQLI